MTHREVGVGASQVSSVTRAQGISGMVWPGHRHKEAGLSVVLRPIRGLTRRGLLRHPFHFQVPPLDEFGWDVAHGWSDYEAIRKGQFSRSGSRQLRTMTLRSLVVDYNPSWASWAGGHRHMGGGDLTPGHAPLRVTDPLGNPTGTTSGANGAQPMQEPGGIAPNPRRVADQLTRLCHAGTPMRLIVWNRALYNKPDVDMPITLRSVSVRERAGEPDSRYFNLTFTEYREAQQERRGYGKNRRHELPALVRVNRNGVAVELEHGDEELRRGQRHKIGSADNPATLRKLSKHFYGHTRGWRRIAAKNGLRNVNAERDLGAVVRRKKGRKYLRLTIPRQNTRGPGGAVSGQAKSGTGVVD